MNCPRCVLKKLINITIANASAYSCLECKGILVPQEKFLKILDAWEKKLKQSALEFETLPIAIDDELLLMCPKCRRPMEHFGYLNSNKAFLDNCIYCKKIWLDKDEISTVALMHYITKYNLRITKETTKLGNCDMDLESQNEVLENVYFILNILKRVL